MKILIAMLLVAAPVAAQAMGMRGGMHGGAGIHLAMGLYAVLAVLGYWVLQHSAKETVNYVRKTGQVLAWALIVIGLLGVLCGMVNHAKMSAKNCRCSGAGMMEPDKMGNMPMMHADCPMKGGMMNKPEAAPKKK